MSEVTSEVTSEVAVEQPSTPASGSLLDTATPANEEYVDVPNADEPIDDNAEVDLSWLPEGIESQEDLVNKYNELLNPVVPEDYEVVLPEGSTLELNEGIESFKDMAKDLGLNQESFTKAMAFYDKLESDRVAIDTAERQAQSLALLGSNAQARLANFNAKARGMLNAEEYELLQRATSNSYDSAGAAILLLEKYMVKVEHNPMGQVAQAPRMTEGELQAMMKDPRYKSDKDYRNQVMEGFRALYA